MITRHCDACEKPIGRPQFVELSLRVLYTNGTETQDAVQQVQGDYCDACILDGSALSLLAKELTHKLRK